MRVINQPWNGRGQQMGDHLVRLLREEPPFTFFRACVAFAKASGILQLAPSLQTYMTRGGRVEVVVGVDEGITTKQALELIITYSTVAYVFNNPVSTFHPKVYLFETPKQRAVAFIGSSNLTVGGLFTNYEANIGLEFDLTVASDRSAYADVSAIFQNATDPTTGNAKRLDQALLNDLMQARLVANETRRTRGRVSGRRVEAPLFPRTPVPPAPSIDPALTQLIPRFKPTGDAESDQSSVFQFEPWSIFVMTLGERDTRQQTGYSRDVYIPLAARKANQQFWGWQDEFSLGSGKTAGRYMERRIDMLVRPANGETQLVEGVRLYDYDIKHEFRLNCSRLTEGAKPGDLLMIQKSPVGTLFDGQEYEYEATILSTRHPNYRSFVKECRNQIKGSRKQWGYL